MALQGVCEIELRDEQGNIVQKTKDKNMVTNAIDKIVNMDLISELNLKYGYTHNYSTRYNSIFPILDKIIGGIVMFNNVQNEDANNILFFQYDIVGSAGVYNNIVDDNRIGVFNIEESSIIYDEKSNAIGMKFVFDFATNQSNGTIKSISLTSALAGISSFKNNLVIVNPGSALNPISTFSYLDGEINKNSIEVNESFKDYIYFFAQFKEDEYIYIDRTGFNFKKVKLKNKIGLCNPIDNFSFYSGEILKIQKIESIGKVNTTGEYLYKSIHAYGDYIYLTYLDNKTLIILKYNPDDLTYERTTKDLTDTLSGVSSTNYMCTVFKNYYIVQYYKNSKYYLSFIDQSDLTITKEFEIIEYCIELGYFYDKSLVAMSNREYISIDDKLNFICKNNIAYRESLTYEMHIPVQSKMLKPPFILTRRRYNNNSSYTHVSYAIQVNSHIKFTIDNLQTPVTKTASQTMKVIYTIKDAEETT